MNNSIGNAIINSKTAFILALDQIEGVGRVSIRKITDAFESQEALTKMPYEQALLRMKGIPRAEALLKTLLNASTFAPYLEEAEKNLHHLASVQVQAINHSDENWPPFINNLDASHCPNVLYGFGHLSILPQRSVALFGKPPLTSFAFELVQDLCRFLLSENILLASGISNGFDTVMHKLASSAGKPSIMLTNCGLAKVIPSIRPQIMQSVRAGGLLLSSFPFHHGTFEHDDFERALLLAAMSPVSVFCDIKPNTADWRAMKWAVEHKRAVFSIGGEDLPEQVQAISNSTDFPWVKLALQV